MNPFYILGLTYDEAVEYCENLVLAGYDDWRIPSLKELFSISDFGKGWPYLDTSYFKLATGLIDKSEQFWSSNRYVGVTSEGKDSAAFGVNHVTGHIKAYPATSGMVGGGEMPSGDDPQGTGTTTPPEGGTGTLPPADTTGMGTPLPGGEGTGVMTNPLAKHVRAVRGNEYGINEYSDNEDGTITDESKIGPSIDPLFSVSSIISEAGNDDYPYFWTSTSANFTKGEPYYYAWYVAFGRAVNGNGVDSHGAGAVRFDTKYEGGPLGEGGERFYNYVRLVRDVY